MGRICPENYNLCEYIVSQVTIKPQNNLADQEKHIQTAVEYFQESDIYRNLQTNISKSLFMYQKIVSLCFVIDKFFQIELTRRQMWHRIKLKLH